MKPYYCEKCEFFDELESEQPCCGCIDGVNLWRQTMNKQIEEMTREIFDNFNCRVYEDEAEQIAMHLYLAGYRKQSKGKWVEQKRETTSLKGDKFTYYIHFCSECGFEIGTITSTSKYCPNCGAHMEGGADK